MLIEHLDVKQAKVVSDLIVCYQIQESRLNEQVNNLLNPKKTLSEINTTENNIDSTLEKTIELYIRATDLFKFARHKVNRIDHPDCQEGDIHNAIIIMNLDVIFDVNFLNIVAEDLVCSLKYHRRSHGYLYLFRRNR